MDESRKLEIEVALDATADQVWAAISEAEGIVKWFAPIASVKPGESITLSWGPGMEMETPVRVWEPGKQLGTGDTRLVDYHIEARDGGGTTLRVVQSGFGSGANFDQEIDSLQGGWQTFFAMLRYGLARFPGAPAVNVFAFRMASESKAEAWRRMLQAIQFRSAGEGSSYTAVLGGIALEGTVLRNPKDGYLCLSVPPVEHSLLSIFVEGGKKAMITVEWVLFGSGGMAREAEVRGAIEELVGVLAPASS